MNEKNTMTKEQVRANREAIADWLKHEPVVNNAPRIHASWEPGDIYHQGDIITLCLKAMPKSAKLSLNKQIIDGDTQGSRHCFDGNVYDADPAEIVQMIHDATGRIVEPEYVGRVWSGVGTLSHPEHGHHVYQCDHVTVAIIQRNVDLEGAIRRSKD